MAKLIGGTLAGREVETPQDLLAENIRDYPARLKINGRWLTVSQIYELHMDGNYHFRALQIEGEQLQEKFGDDWAINGGAFHTN